MSQNKSFVALQFNLVPHSLTAVAAMLSRMECNEEKIGVEVNNNIKKIYDEFMAGIARFDELVGEGGKLVVSFHQGLQFLRRPSLKPTSDLVEKIIEGNGTKRLKSYIEAGCINVSDGLQNLNKSRSILNELENLVEDVYDAMELENEMLLTLQDKDCGIRFDQISLEDEVAEFQEDMALSRFQQPGVIDYVALIGIIHSMVKQDFAMQERIVQSINLTTPSGELETYCMMWDLRPFINDEIVHQAWKLIP